ncbi:MAG: iron-containing alcohol dehydrogenase [Candidatus Omnitrophica bacterium]|nr:iron-containing alcohol dehydrogenase [Candidatus Omnitrophota bacterium]
MMKKLIVKIISSIVLVTFVAEDIVWADPGVLKNRNEVNSLAVWTNFDDPSEESYVFVVGKILEFMDGRKLEGLAGRKGFDPEIAPNRSEVVGFHWDAKRYDTDDSLVIPIAIYSKLDVEHRDPLRWHEVVISPNGENITIRPKGKSVGAPVSGDAVSLSEPLEADNGAMPRLISGVRETLYKKWLNLYDPSSDVRFNGVRDLGLMVAALIRKKEDVSLDIFVEKLTDVDTVRSMAIETLKKINYALIETERDPVGVIEMQKMVGEYIRDLYNPDKFFEGYYCFNEIFKVLAEIDAKLIENGREPLSLDLYKWAYAGGEGRGGDGAWVRELAVEAIGIINEVSEKLMLPDILLASVNAEISDNPEHRRGNELNESAVKAILKAKDKKTAGKARFIEALVTLADHPKAPASEVLKALAELAPKKIEARLLAASEDLQMMRPDEMAEVIPAMMKMDIESVNKGGEPVYSRNIGPRFAEMVRKHVEKADDDSLAHLEKLFIMFAAVNSALIQNGRNKDEIYIKLAAYMTSRVVHIANWAIKAAGMIDRAHIRAGERTVYDEELKGLSLHENPEIMITAVLELARCQAEKIRVTGKAESAEYFSWFEKNLETEDAKYRGWMAENYKIRLKESAWISGLFSMNKALIEQGLPERVGSFYKALENMRGEHPNRGDFYDSLSELCADLLEKGKRPLHLLAPEYEYEKDFSYRGNGRLMARVIGAEGFSFGDAGAKVVKFFIKHGLPMDDRILMEKCLEYASADEYLRGLEAKAWKAMNDGFDIKNDSDNFYAYLGAKLAGVSMTKGEYDTHMAPVRDITYGAPDGSNFKDIFNKRNKLKPLEVGASGVRELNTSEVSSRTIETHVSRLMDLKRKVDDLSILSEYFPGHKRLSVRNLYYLFKYEEAGKIQGDGKRAYVTEAMKSRSEEDMREELMANKEFVYRAAYELAARRIVDPALKDKCLVVMRDVVIAAVLERPGILDMITRGQGEDISEKMQYLKVLYEDNARDALETLGNGLGGGAEVKAELLALSEVFYKEYEKAKFVDTVVKHTFDLIPVGFLGTFQGRAGIDDCSFDMDKGLGFMRAYQEDALGYFVYRKGQLVGWIGLVWGKNDKGEKVLTVDTIESPVFDGEELILNFLKEMHKYALAEGGIGIAMPRDLWNSYNFSNHNTIGNSRPYREGDSIKITPLHGDSWNYFTKKFGRVGTDKFISHSMDSGEFVLLNMDEDPPQNFSAYADGKRKARRLLEEKKDWMHEAGHILEVLDRKEDQFWWQFMEWGVTLKTITQPKLGIKGFLNGYKDLGYASRWSLGFHSGHQNYMGDILPYSSYLLEGIESLSGVRWVLENMKKVPWNMMDERDRINRDLEILGFMEGILEALEKTADPEEAEETSETFEGGITRDEMLERLITLEDHELESPEVYQGTILATVEIEHRQEVYVLSVGHGAKVGQKVKASFHGREICGEIVKYVHSKNKDLSLIKLYPENPIRHFDILPIAGTDELPYTSEPGETERGDAVVVLAEYEEAARDIARAAKTIRAVDTEAEITRWVGDRHETIIIYNPACNRWGSCGVPVYVRGKLIGVFNSGDDEQDGVGLGYAGTSDAVTEFLSATEYAEVDTSLAGEAQKERDLAKFRECAHLVTFRDLMREGRDGRCEEPMYSDDQVERVKAILGKNNIKESDAYRSVLSAPGIDHRVKLELHDILIDEYIAGFYAAGAEAAGKRHFRYDDRETLSKIKDFFTDVLGRADIWGILLGYIEEGKVNVLEADHGLPPLFDAHASATYGINISASCRDDRRGAAIVHEAMSLAGSTDDAFNLRVEAAYAAGHTEGNAEIMGIKNELSEKGLTSGEGYAPGNATRDTRRERMAARYEELLKPYDDVKAEARRRRYPGEKEMYAPEVETGANAAEKYLKGLLRGGSEKRFIVVTSPLVRAQMEKWVFPGKDELLSRAMDVEDVNFRHIDKERFGEGSYFDKAEEIAKGSYPGTEGSGHNYPELVVGIGLGSVTDWAKLIGKKFSADVVIIPSALSTNAPFTGNAIIRDEDRDGGNYTLYSAATYAPRKVVVDPDFISLNPRGNTAGAGGLMSGWVALNDWRLALSEGEREDEAVRRKTEELLRDLVKSAPAIRSGGKEGLKAITYLNARSAALITEFGSERPRTGSEHILAETLEKLTRGRKILHGEMIGITTLIMSYIYTRMRSDVIQPEDLFAIARNAGVETDLGKIGLTREDLITALEGTRPKKGWYSFFDLTKVERKTAEEIVNKLFPDMSEGEKEVEGYLAPGHSITPDEFENALLVIFGVEEDQITRGTARYLEEEYPYTMFQSENNNKGPVYFRAGEIFAVNYGLKPWDENEKAMGKGSGGKMPGMRRKELLDRLLARYPYAIRMFEEATKYGEGGWWPYTYHPRTPEGYYYLAGAVGQLIALQANREIIRGRTYIDALSRNGIMANAALLLGAKDVVVIENDRQDIDTKNVSSPADSTVLPATMDLIGLNLALNGNGNKARVYYASVRHITEETFNEAVLSYSLRHFAMGYYDASTTEIVEAMRSDPKFFFGDWVPESERGKGLLASKRESLIKDIREKFSGIRWIIASGGSEPDSLGDIGETRKLIHDAFTLGMKAEGMVDIRHGWGYSYAKHGWEHINIYPTLVFRVADTDKLVDRPEADVEWLAHSKSEREAFFSKDQDVLLGRIRLRGMLGGLLRKVHKDDIDIEELSSALNSGSEWVFSEVLEELSEALYAPETLYPLPPYDELNYEANYNLATVLANTFPGHVVALARADVKDLGGNRHGRYMVKIDDDICIDLVYGEIEPEYKDRVLVISKKDLGPERDRIVAVFKPGNVENTVASSRSPVIGPTLIMLGIIVLSSAISAFCMVVPGGPAVICSAMANYLPQVSIALIAGAVLWIQRGGKTSEAPRPKRKNVDPGVIDAERVLDECEKIAPVFFEAFRKIYPADPGSCEGGAYTMAHVLAGRLGLAMDGVSPNRVEMEMVLRPGTGELPESRKKGTGHVVTVVWLGGKKAVFIDMTHGQFDPKYFNKMVSGRYDDSMKYLGLMNIAEGDDHFKNTAPAAGHTGDRAARDIAFARKTGVGGYMGYSGLPEQNWGIFTSDRRKRNCAVCETTEEKTKSLPGRILSAIEKTAPIPGEARNARGPVIGPMMIGMVFMVWLKKLADRSARAKHKKNRHGYGMSLRGFFINAVVTAVELGSFVLAVIQLKKWLASEKREKPPVIRTGGSFRRGGVTRLDLLNGIVLTVILTVALSLSYNYSPELFEKAAIGIGFILTAFPAAGLIMRMRDDPDSAVRVLRKLKPAAIPALALLMVPNTYLLVMGIGAIGFLMAWVIMSSYLGKNSLAGYIPGKIKRSSAIPFFHKVYGIEHQDGPLPTGGGYILDQLDTGVSIPGANAAMTGKASGQTGWDSEKLPGSVKYDGKQKVMTEISWMWYPEDRGENGPGYVVQLMLADSLDADHIPGTPLRYDIELAPYLFHGEFTRPVNAGSIELSFDELGRVLFGGTGWSASLLDGIEKAYPWLLSLLSEGCKAMAAKPVMPPVVIDPAVIDREVEAYVNGITGDGKMPTAEEFELALNLIFGLKNWETERGSVLYNGERYAFTRCSGTTRAEGPVYFRAGDMFVLNAAARSGSREPLVDLLLSKYRNVVKLYEEIAPEGHYGWFPYKAGKYISGRSYYLDSTIGQLIAMQAERKNIEGHTFIDAFSRNAVIGNAAFLLGASDVVCIENDPQAVDTRELGTRRSDKDFPQKTDLVTANLIINGNLERSRIYNTTIRNVPEREYKNAILAFSFEKFGYGYLETSYSEYLAAEKEQPERLRKYGDWLDETPRGKAIMATKRESLIGDIRRTFPGVNVIIASGGVEARKIDNYGITNKIIREAASLGMKLRELLEMNIDDEIWDDGSLIERKQQLVMPTLVFRPMTFNEKWAYSLETAKREWRDLLAIIGFLPKHKNTAWKDSKWGYLRDRVTRPLALIGVWAAMGLTVSAGIYVSSFGFILGYWAGLAIVMGGTYASVRFARYYVNTRGHAIYDTLAALMPGLFSPLMMEDETGAAADPRVPVEELISRIKRAFDAGEDWRRKAEAIELTLKRLAGDGEGQGQAAREWDKKHREFVRLTRALSPILNGDIKGSGRVIYVDDFSEWRYVMAGFNGGEGAVFLGCSFSPVQMMAMLSMLESRTKGIEGDGHYLTLKDKLIIAAVMGYPMAAFVYRPVDNGHIVYHEAIEAAITARGERMDVTEGYTSESVSVAEISRIVNGSDDAREETKELKESFIAYMSALRAYPGDNLNSEFFSWLAAVARYPDAEEHIKAYKPTSDAEAKFLAEREKNDIGRRMDEATRRFVAAVVKYPELRELIRDYYAKLINDVPEMADLLAVPAIFGRVVASEIKMEDVLCMAMMELLRRKYDAYTETTIKAVMEKYDGNTAAETIYSFLSFIWGVKSEKLIDLGHSDGVEYTHINVEDASAAMELIGEKFRDELREIVIRAADYIDTESLGTHLDRILLVVLEFAVSLSNGAPEALLSKLEDSSVAFSPSLFGKEWRGVIWKKAYRDALTGYGWNSYAVMKEFMRGDTQYELFIGKTIGDVVDDLASSNDDARSFAALEALEQKFMDLAETRQMRGIGELPESTYSLESMLIPAETSMKLAGALKKCILSEAHPFVSRTAMRLYYSIEEIQMPDKDKMFMALCRRVLPGIKDAPGRCRAARNIAEGCPGHYALYDDFINVLLGVVSRGRKIERGLNELAQNLRGRGARLLPAEKALAEFVITGVDLADLDGKASDENVTARELIALVVEAHKNGHDWRTAALRIEDELKRLAGTTPSAGGRKKRITEKYRDFAKLARDAIPILSGDKTPGSGGMAEGGGTDILTVQRFIGEGDMVSLAAQITRGMQGLPDAAARIEIDAIVRKLSRDLGEKLRAELIPYGGTPGSHEGRLALLALERLDHVVYIGDNSALDLSMKVKGGAVREPVKGGAYDKDIIRAKLAEISASSGLNITKDISSKDEAMEAVFGDDGTIYDFLKTATLCRNACPYDLTRYDTRPPLQFALEEGLYIRIGKDLFMTPVSESFRRHIVFTRNGDGTIGSAFEALIPGDNPARLDTACDKRSGIIDRIRGIYPLRGYIVPWKQKIYLTPGTYELYGVPLEFPESEIKNRGLVLYDYEEDGKRLSNVTPEAIAAIAARFGVTVRRVEEEIFSQLAEITAAIHNIKLLAHWVDKDGATQNEYGLHNFRLIVTERGIRLTLPGDVTSFQALGLIRSLASGEARFTDVKQLIPSDKRTVPPLARFIRALLPGEQQGIFLERYKEFNRTAELIREVSSIRSPWVFRDILTTKEIVILSADEKVTVFRYPLDGRGGYAVGIRNMSDSTIEGITPVELHTMGIDPGKEFELFDRSSYDVIKFMPGINVFSKGDALGRPEGSIYYKLAPREVHVFEIWPERGVLTEPAKTGTVSAGSPALKVEDVRVKVLGAGSNPGLSMPSDIPMDINAVHKVLAEGDNARKIAELARSLRLVCPHYPPIGDERTPLEYALNEGLVVKLGGTDYIKLGLSPLGARGDEFIFYAREMDGRLKFACNIRIPEGDVTKDRIGISEIDIKNDPVTGAYAGEGLYEPADRAQALKDRLARIMGSGKTPVISADIDDTLLKFGADMNDEVLGAVERYVEKGGVLVFNTKGDNEWFYKRFYEIMRGYFAERGKLHLLSNIPVILCGGKQAFIYDVLSDSYKVVFESWGLQKSEGLLRLIDHLGRDKHELLALYGDQLWEYWNDGNAVGTEGIDIIVNVGENRYHGIPGWQNFFNTNFAGPQATLGDIEMFTEQLEGHGVPVLPIDTKDLPGFKRFVFRKGTGYGSRWNWRSGREGASYQDSWPDHEGIDFYEYQNEAGETNPVKVGTSVRAVLPGRVFIGQKSAGTSFNSVVIDHGKGKVSLYRHVYSKLNSGEEVKQGDIIGEIASEACPHLHFEILEGIDLSSSAIWEWAQKNFDKTRTETEGLLAGGFDINEIIRFEYYERYREDLSINPFTVFSQLKEVASVADDDTITQAPSPKLHLSVVALAKADAPCLAGRQACPPEDTEYYDPFTDGHQIWAYEGIPAGIAVSGPNPEKLPKGFVWSGTLLPDEKSWANVHYTAIRELPDGRWGAPLSEGATIFRIFWTGGDDASGGKTAGHYEPGEPFRVKYIKADIHYYLNKLRGVQPPKPVPSELAARPAVIDARVALAAPEPALESSPFGEFAGEVGYQIMVDRFKKSLGNNKPRDKIPAGHGRIYSIGPVSWDKPWYELTDFEKKWAESHGQHPDSILWTREYGGDLQGVIDELDYLKDMGIGFIYFNPVFWADTHHKYNAKTLHHIDPWFGPDPEGDMRLIETEDPLDPNKWVWTSADKLFMRLISEAHEKGIKVVLDGVFNHTGNQFFALQDIIEKTKRGEPSPFFDWYKWWRNDDGSFGWEGWWGDVDALPELRRDNEGNYPRGYVEYVNNILKRWMIPGTVDGKAARGIDGWRLDVECQLHPKFRKQLYGMMKAIDPEAIVISEPDWGNTYEQMNEGTSDSTMNYPFLWASARLFIDGLKPSTFVRAIEGLAGLYPARLRDTIFNSLGTHDTERIATARLEPNPPKERVDHMAYGDYARVRNHSGYENGQVVLDGSYKLEAGPDEIDAARKVSKQLATYLLTAPGMPVIYYGDEIGLPGDNDPGCRRPMLWEETAAGKPDIELREHYRKMARLRNETPSLKYGSFEIVSADDERRLVVMLRRYKGENAFIFFNTSEVDQDISFLPGEGYAGASITDRVSGLAHNIRDGKLEFKIHAKGSAVFVMKKGKEAPAMNAAEQESATVKTGEIGNIIAIGGSRYGYQALEEIIKRLPADHPPVVAAEHLDHFAKLAGGDFARFIRESGRNIVLADNEYFGDSRTKDIILEKGMAVIAKFVYVLRDSEGWTVARVFRDETDCHQFEEAGAIDVLYSSAAELFRDKVIIIQTSGLGYDGVLGAEKAASAGAEIITQKVDPDGPFAGAGKMPSKVLEAVPGARNLPLEEIAGAVMGLVSEGVGIRAVAYEEVLGDALRLAGVDGVFSDFDGVDRDRDDRVASDDTIQARAGMSMNGVLNFTVTGLPWDDFMIRMGGIERASAIGADTPYRILTNTGADGRLLRKDGRTGDIEGFVRSVIGGDGAVEEVRKAAKKALLETIMAESIDNKRADHIRIKAEKGGVTIYLEDEVDLKPKRFDMARRLRVVIDELKRSGKISSSVEVVTSSGGVDVIAITKGASVMRMIKQFGLKRVVILADSVGTAKDPGNDRSMLALTRDDLRAAGIDWDVDLIKIYTGHEEGAEMPEGVIIAPRMAKESQPAITLYRAVSEAKENAEKKTGIEDLVADCVGDIRKEEELAWSLQSAFMRFTRRVGSEKMLIVAIEDGVTEKGFDKERFEKIVNEWKDSVVKLEGGDVEKKNMRRFLDNIVLTFFTDKADLEVKLDENGVSGKDMEGNYIFVYTGDASNASSYRGMGADVRPVMIRQNEKEKAFYPGYYYPLAEIVALSLNKELLNVDVNTFMAGLEKRGINLEELGIDDISNDPELGFMVFTILPKIERSPGGGKADRFEKFLRFMRSV